MELTYTTPELSIRMRPSHPEKINYLQAGSIAASTSTRQVEISWTAKEYIFTVAYYGDSLTVVIANTPQLAESFANTAKIWNTFLD